MTSDTNTKLVDLLERLRSGQDAEQVRNEAREFLTTLDPTELSAAECELAAAGLEPEDMHPLCSVHMEMLFGEVDKLKSRVAPGHVLHTLVSEHDLILGFLNQLEDVNRRVQTMERYDPAAEEFSRLTPLAEHLVETEAHHQREEEVLFPEVESRGVYGPTQVMRMEHQTLRRRKQELKTLAEQVGRLDFAEFKKRLDVVGKFIVATLRDHIFKENNILYPAALQVIPEEKWSRLKAQCDTIGYCCFTPKG